MRVFLALALLGGCTTGLPTIVTGLTVSSGPKDHISLVECIDRDEVAEIAPVLWALLTQRTAEQGYVKDGQLAKWILGSDVRVCLIDEPQPCCMGGWPCAGPCEEKDGVMICARKAGCATIGYAWVSKTWPPKCTANQHKADAARCGDPNPDYDWRQTMIHEMGNVLRLQYLNGEYYNETDITSYYGPDGPIASAYRALIAK